MKQFLHPGILFGLHQINTYNTQQHAACGYQRRSQYGFHLQTFYG